jgi:hypothetical protein
MEIKMRPVFSARKIIARPGDNDTIDRHARRQHAGRHVRTLQRWHHTGYGPPRKPWRHGVFYSRAEVEQWIADHPADATNPVLSDI